MESLLVDKVVVMESAAWMKCCIMRGNKTSGLKWTTLKKNDDPGSDVVFLLTEYVVICWEDTGIRSLLCILSCPVVV